MPFPDPPSWTSTLTDLEDKLIEMALGWTDRMGFRQDAARFQLAGVICSTGAFSLAEALKLAKVEELGWEQVPTYADDTKTFKKSISAEGKNFVD